MPTIPAALIFLMTLVLSGCAALPPPPPPVPSTTTAPTCPPCAACPVCPGVEPAKPEAKPLQPAAWSDLPDWLSDDPLPAFEAFRASCTTLAKRPLWRASCESAQNVNIGAGPSQADVPPVGGSEPNLRARGASKVGVGGTASETARAWFEGQFQPWALVQPDGDRSGLVTGYYEPVIRGSRTRKAPYLTPVFAPPDDLIVVELDSLYPELKHMRLRGRIEGRKLVPYLDRAGWNAQEILRTDAALLWVDDQLDFFFLQIQGSGQVALDDGSRVRIGYADQNGHPYRSIGRWLIDQNELRAHEASMQGIKAWAVAHPRRLQELLNVNPSMVFFRELPATGSGPPGALGVPLTPERSIAVDPRHVPLGAPVWLATTQPNSEQALKRLMLAQDTGGAIRGAVRADFYWGSGVAAGNLAGKMKQRGMMWVLLPRGHAP
ncbi:MAG: MltA domain-containing protein [Gammaproteobacteria bacterium]|nr:murein transglycosylase [Rhodocyclaceae bacterium]MBU3909341.1 MltA domain-containing protein [Gammaproteobacteria bacterium]MBU3988711.1 MltA domain-containing protein [Gammaproteobacteria bacterium]MBU4005499.1 MltA domain-containing protein [Gammaproteobacteria bacterium]MBU4020948.1 MltA domain-containing protein [Gammaproteobacteria bacterium]